MKNSDLIAHIKPISSQFSHADTVELIDITGRVTDIEASQHGISMRLSLPSGLYRGRLAMAPGSFSMATAMIDMVQVPDGRRVPVGPWDLDHIHNVMAMPMLRTYVNGQLKGGLWFSMPGPDEIADERLNADFGFEAQQGENELVLELIERDRPRLKLGKLAHFELREDDRRPVPLEPATSSHPRIFLNAEEAKSCASAGRELPSSRRCRSNCRQKSLSSLRTTARGRLNSHVSSTQSRVTCQWGIERRNKSSILRMLQPGAAGPIHY